MTAPEEDPDATLVRLVSIALESRANGGDVSLEDICRDHRDLLPAVADALEIAARLGDVEPMAPPPNEDLPVLGGRYRCEVRLGAGSMGVVYRARDVELDREVAVKVLRSDLRITADADERFARETVLLASIRHPAVVTIHDRGRTVAGAPFFVMELLEGVPLHLLAEAAADVVERDSFAALDGFAWAAAMLGPTVDRNAGYVRTVVGWIAHLAEGLHAAHEASVLHRDLKPSNAFLRRGGSPVLLDFGIAARLGDLLPGERTSALGTAAYLAPELAAGAAPSVRADVYGLTATLYHLLTLQMPYEGTPQQILQRLPRHDPIPVGARRHDLPRDLRAIVDRGMARKPERRYATALDLAADLRAFLSYRPVTARRTTAIERTWRRARRSPSVRVAALCALVAIAVFAVVQWLHVREATRRSEWAEVWSHLPPSLTLWNQRVLSGERREAAAGLLDRAARIAVDAVPTLVVRAALRADHGDVAGAVADLASVAADVGTPLAVELARRGAAAADPAVLETDGLPAPSSDEDRYLLAFHQLRRRDAVAARTTLGSAADSQYPPSCELWLALQVPALRSESTSGDAVDLARTIYEDAVRLEARISRRTATTAHLIANALIGQGRYPEARAVLVDGIALATPAFQGLHANLAVVERRLGAHEAAIEQCRIAIALSAGTESAHETLVMLLADRADLDGARQALATASLRPNVRAGLEARLAFLDARAAWRDDDLDAARDLAARAIELSSAAPPRRESAHELAFCSAIVSGRDVFATMLQAACRNLEDPWVVHSLVLPVMPTDLDAAQTTQVRLFLEAWSQQPSPDPR